MWGYRGLRVVAAVIVTAGACAGASLAATAGASASTALTGFGDWPMFHSDALRTGIAPDTSIGASAAQHLDLAWKSFATGFKQLDASPAIVFNSDWQRPLVYSATDAGTISARDLVTGAIVWSSTGNGPIESSPAVIGNTVYVGTESRHLLALNGTNGDLECSYAATGAIIGSPVVGDVDGTGPVVFFGDDGESEAKNAGREWAVTGVGNSDGPCTLKWSFNTWKNKGPAVERTGSWSPPALTTDSTGRPLLVFGSSDPDDAVYALDARTGQQVWRFQTKVTNKDQDVGAAPTIGAPGGNGFSHGVVYIDGKDKLEYALDLLTGARVWQFDLAARSGVPHANAQSTAALVGNRVIVPYAKYVFSINAVNGKQVWRSHAAAGTFFSSPSVSGSGSDRVAFVGDSAGLEHAYSVATGVEVNRVTAGGPIFSSAALAYGTVVFGADDGYLYALRRGAVPPL